MDTKALQKQLRSAQAAMGEVSVGSNCKREEISIGEQIKIKTSKKNFENAETQDILLHEQKQMDQKAD